MNGTAEGSLLLCLVAIALGLSVQSSAPAAAQTTPAPPQLDSGESTGPLRLAVITARRPPECPAPCRWWGDWVHLHMSVASPAPNRDNLARVLRAPGWGTSRGWGEHADDSFWLWDGWRIILNVDHIDAIDFPSWFDIQYVRVEALEYVRPDLSAAGRRIFAGSTPRITSTDSLTGDFQPRMEVAYRAGDVTILATIYRILNAHGIHRGPIRFVYRDPVFIGGRVSVSVQGGRTSPRRLVVSDVLSPLVTNAQIREVSRVCPNTAPTLWREAAEGCEVAPEHPPPTRRRRRR